MIHTNRCKAKYQVLNKYKYKSYITFLPYCNLTLVMIRGKYTLVMIGGGTKCPPPLFLFVKSIEKVIRLCTVLRRKKMSGSFEDRAIFHVS